MISPETRMMGLPYGEEIMIVGQTMWTQSTSVTDRQTDRITIRKTVQRRASHGKNRRRRRRRRRRICYRVCCHDPVPVLSVGWLCTSIPLPARGLSWSLVIVCGRHYRTPLLGHLLFLSPSIITTQRQNLILISPLHGG